MFENPTRKMYDAIFGADYDSPTDMFSQAAKTATSYLLHNAKCFAEGRCGSLEKLKLFHQYMEEAQMSLKMYMQKNVAFISYDIASLRIKSLEREVGVRISLLLSELFRRTYIKFDPYSYGLLQIQAWLNHPEQSEFMATLFERLMDFNFDLRNYSKEMFVKHFS